MGANPALAGLPREAQTGPNAPRSHLVFLDGIITTFIESGSMAWFYVEEYEPGDTEAEPVVPAWARIEPQDNEGTVHWVTRGTVQRGLDVIRAAQAQHATRLDGTPGDFVLHNVETGERLYLHETTRMRILMAESNPDGEHDGPWAGDLDAVDAYAIVECGLFGRVVYG